MSRKDLLALGLWCGAVLALLAPVWVRSGAVFFNHGDLYTYHVPLRSITAGALQEGRLPFWDPYILLGLPHAANPQAALFYPPALLEAFFPVSRGLLWDQIFHLLWAGAGMFLLARAQRLERWGAAVLASSFALSPFLVYRVTAGIPTLLAALSWTPWLWLAWLSGFPGLLAAAFALQLFSGHGQFLLINAAGMSVWCLARGGSGVLLARLPRAAAACAALAAAQWALTAQFLRLSVRAEWSGALSGLYALPAGALWTWLAPGALGTPGDGGWTAPLSEFYEGCGGHVGLVALALAAWGAARGRRRLPAALLAGLGILLACGPRLAPARALLSLPVLSYLRTPVRWLFLAVWAVLLLAGAGLASLRGRRWPLGARALLAAAAFAMLAAWDAAYLRPQDPAFFLKPNREVSDLLAGRPFRVLTDPELANPNKAALYRMRNVNGYEAFYLKGVPAWAAAAQGAPAADASRVFVSRWPTAALARAGVVAHVSSSGIGWAPGWPLAAFVDARGRRVGAPAKIFIASPERWRVFGRAPAAAVALVLSEAAYPGWSAWLDGAPARLVSWGGVFQALPWPGDGGAAHAVTFEFRPTGWPWLAALAIAAWAWWLAALLRRASEAA